MKRNHGYIILWGKWEGIAFSVGNRRSGSVLLALLRLVSSRRRSDPTLAASSRGAFLIEDEGLFSVLTSGEVGLAGGAAICNLLGKNQIISVSYIEIELNDGEIIYFHQIKNPFDTKDTIRKENPKLKTEE